MYSFLSTYSFGESVKKYCCEDISLIENYIEAVSDDSQVWHCHHRLETHYPNGEKRYIVSPHGLKVGQTVMSGIGVAPEIGNTLLLSEIPFGTMIHNIELNPGQGAKLVRSAGSYAQLMSRDGKYAIVKMPSGETRMILQSCRATIGIVSNVEHNLEISGKAGRSRWLGRRPRTRGVVMNPVDHPMGGGEGRQAGGHPRSRKGIPAKGYKTRAPKKQSSKYIVERRKK